jgi:DNA-binding response OmpR family regulator
MRLLIAEDDMTSRAILQAVLAKWGYDVGRRMLVLQNEMREREKLQEWK